MKKTMILTVLILLSVLILHPFALLSPAAAPSAHFLQPGAPVSDSPAITIAGATVDSAVTPSTAAHEAQIQWVFGTVAGSYSGCTVQAKTTYDGSTWLTLGSGASLTVTSSTVNAWTLIEQMGTTSVTTSAVSSSVALSFGLQTKFTFACSGYGTTAPVTVSVIYR